MKLKNFTVLQRINSPLQD